MLLGAIGVGAVLLALPPSSGADQSPSIAQLQAENADLAAKARSAELDLYSLDAQLASAQSRLASLEVEMARLEAQRRSIREELGVAVRDIRLSERLVAARLRYLYDYGAGPSPLEVVLGSASISQVLTGLDEVNNVSAADTSVLAQLHTARSRLGWLAHALAVRGQRLAAAQREVAATITELGQAQAARTAYLSQLEQQQSYNNQRISVLTAEAQAALERALQLQREREAAAAAARSLTVVPTAQGPQLSAEPSAAAPAVSAGSSSPAPGGGQSITVTATGYDLHGTTATGVPVGYGVAAVDPSVIPLGTHFTVPGYGEVVAADTGGAIVGPRVDLWFPTAAQAEAWGVRTVTIVVGG